MKKIRMATIADAQTMLEIYSPYVLGTAISFETELPTIKEFSGRVADKLAKFPWLVCELDGRIAGYAYAGHYNPRPAYSWTAESTVYVKTDCHGQGVGKILYESLLGALKEKGIVNVVGGITLPNVASVGLHEHFGFVQVGKVKDAGFKMGRWWDVGYWQLQFPKPDLALR